MREILHITVLSKSGFTTTRAGSKFLITTKEFGELMCFKRILHNKFEVGEELDIIFQNSNKRIVGIEGFDSDIVNEDSGYPQEIPPANGAEAVLYHKLSLSGWDITRRGFPDFACFKEGRFITIEVKPKRSHRLKKRQQQVMEALAKAGIECYKWSPDGGFERILERQDNL